MAEDFPYQIVSHTIPASFLREYPHAVVNDDEDLILELKQYIPHGQSRASGNGSRNSDGFTIIAAGGLGFVKELYEPLFAEILRRAESVGVNIKGIWMADPVNAGASAVRNRDNLGCDPHWWDHSHDLWKMIEHFRTEMVQPIIGLGHSMGANQMCVAPKTMLTLFLRY
jgi:hypothetical protein